MTLSRRLFLKRAALAGGALAPSYAALGAGSFQLVSRPAIEGFLPFVPASEVVTFFDGQLWLDTSGASRAYRAPSRAHPCALSEDELHCLYGRL